MDRYDYGEIVYRILDAITPALLDAISAEVDGLPLKPREREIVGSGTASTGKTRAAVEYVIKAERPLSAIDVADKLGMKTDSVRKFLRRAHEAGIISRDANGDYAKPEKANA